MIFLDQSRQIPLQLITMTSDIIFDTDLFNEPYLVRDFIVLLLR